MDSMSEDEAFLAAEAERVHYGGDGRTDESIHLAVVLVLVNHALIEKILQELRPVELGGHVVVCWCFGEDMFALAKL